GTKWRLLRDLLGHSVPLDSDESVAAFIRRKFSAELLDKLVGPMISGIYAGDPEKLSLRAAFPQLLEAEHTSGSVIRGALRAAKSKEGPKRKPTIFSFRDGNETLIQALAARLGPALRAGTTVVEILRAGSQHPTSYEVTLSTNGSTEKLIAGNLILSIPAQAAGNLLRGIHPDFSSLLSSIEYAPIAVVSLGYAKAHVQHSLEGFGFLIPRSEKLRILGTVFNSSLFPGRAPADNVLLTSFLGGATDPQAASLAREDLVALVHKELAPILSIQQAPVFSHVQIYENALPQYNLGHAQRIASLEKLASQLSGLWFAGNYLHGPSIGSCVDHSLSTADAVRAKVKQNFAPG
ncbi:MAG: protoporphyrinogen oxidase, partial [Candidatus Acidiferrum sp.]